MKYYLDHNIAMARLCSEMLGFHQGDMDSWSLHFRFFQQKYRYCPGGLFFGVCYLCYMEYFEGAQWFHFLAEKSYLWALEVLFVRDLQLILYRIKPQKRQSTRSWIDSL